MPGVLLVETMAQTAGWLLLALNGFRRMPFLAAVKEAKFRAFVGPGTPLAVHARRSHDGSGYAVATTRIEIGGQAHLRGRDHPAHPALPRSRPGGGDARPRRRHRPAPAGRRMRGREAWITGIGLVSALAEGAEARWAALSAGVPPRVDEDSFAPFPVHPAPVLELDRQIPKGRPAPDGALAARRHVCRWLGARRCGGARAGAPRCT